MSWFEQGMFLERYRVYGWDYGLFGKVPLGTEWDSGRIGVGWKVISFVESHARIS
jgi:hypothetical protein